MILLIILGAIIGINICGGLYFKERAEVFEININRMSRNVTEDLESDWSDFMSKADLSFKIVKLHRLWLDLVKGEYINNYNQISVLRLSIPGIQKYPLDTVVKWMSDYRHNWVTNKNLLESEKLFYNEFLQNAWFKWTNVVWKFPHNL